MIAVLEAILHHFPFFIRGLCCESDSGLSGYREVNGHERSSYNTITKGAQKKMNIIHVERTPDGGYMIVDATGAGPADARFAPVSGEHSEADLRTALMARGLTQKAIDQAVREVNENGNAMITLP